MCLAMADWVDQLCKLPVTFWDVTEGSYSKTTYPETWKTRYDVVKITKVRKKTKKKAEALEFEFKKDEIFVMPLEIAEDLKKRGCFTGPHSYPS